MGSVGRLPQDGLKENLLATKFLLRYGSGSLPRGACRAPVRLKFC